ncbi:MAG: beta-lactamase family protein [Bacteroidales bacterium]|nr:beta-lactamase family protein [Bacteroidales bacterium]
MVVIPGLVLIFSPIYLRKALFYQKAGILDYKFFDNRTIRKAQKPDPWPKSKAYGKLRISDDYMKAFKSLETSSYLVIHNDSILYEKYLYGFDTNTISNAFSATKSIVSLLVGIAIDHGYIQSVDQPVGDFIPRFKAGMNRQLTIKHLLTMSSGLNWDESYESPFSVTTQAYYGEDLRDLIKEMEVVDQPGEYYKYQSGNTQLLAFILEKASGKSVSELTEKYLWKPMGATHKALWSLDKKDGMEKAYCCFNATARDFARIGQLIVNDGKWNGRQLISKSYLDQALQPASYLKEPLNNNPVDFYGYHWWIMQRHGMKIPYARGILGQYIIPVKEKNMVIVRLGNKRSPERVNYHVPDVFTYLDAGMTLLEKQSVD